MLKSSINKYNESKKYIFCPSGTCLDMPKIKYSFSPLITKFKFDCTNLNENEKKIDLKEFLEKSAHIKCFICKREILNDKINYCKSCKRIIDESCYKNHINLCQDIKVNANILNNCLEHGIQYMFRCINCNKSLCYKCDLTYHNDKNHSLEQLNKFSFSKSEINKIRES